MRYLLLTFLLAGGCSTVNINAPQPNLQSVNGGQSSCVMDCQTTQTATQSIGDGDVQGSSITNTTTRTRQPATMPPLN